MPSDWIEELVKAEWRDGVSPGAAARQVCRSLRDGAPVLKALLEELLAQVNLDAHERYLILEEFRAVDGDAGLAAKIRSFRRTNGLPPESPSS